MKILARNSRATFDFAITQRIVAGIVLAGHEVKSIRNGNVRLTGSFATFRDDELWLTNCHVGAYKYAALRDYDPSHSRKLLLKRNELESLKKAKQNGQHIVPISIGLSGKFIKLELGIGRSSKRTDKREDIKRKDINRDIERTFKHSRN